MSRVPPSLEYFVVYNKTLQAPSSTVSKDDDDAQEEAHILFYTCRPGGVKRDKMLRQIGLAKALISFSESVHWPQKSASGRTDVTDGSSGRSRMATARHAKWCILQGRS
jgi:hypothetical protein